MRRMIAVLLPRRGLGLLGLLGVFGVLAAACGGAGAGARSAEAVATSGPDHARMRAATDALGRELGHSVDVVVDAALVEGNPSAPARVAEIVEDFAREVASVNPRSPAACRAGCSPSTSLAMAVDARSLWAGVRRVALRYDASSSRSDRDRLVDYAPDTGTLAYRIAPDGLLRSLPTGHAQRLVFRSALEPRFRGRSPATIGPADLPAYVLYSSQALDPREEAGSAVALAWVYPRLVEPALSVARDQLLAARRFLDDVGGSSYGSLELERAWTMWYRAYASTLDERRLREAAVLVFQREAGELASLPAFDHGFGLLVAQAQNRGTPESAVLACASDDRCYGPLWSYLTDRRRPERRQRLATALLAAHDPALVEFVALRLFVQRETSPGELLGLLAGDPAAWSAAFVPAVLARVSEEVLLDTWRASPALRVPMLRGIGAVAMMPPRTSGRPVSSMRFDETPLGRASHAFNALAHYLCPSPAAAELVALATQNIRADNPVWQHRRTGSGRLCDRP